MLAWLLDEAPAAERVDEVLPSRPLMSWVNLVEVAYRTERSGGAGRADLVVAELRRTLDIELPGTNRMLEVARLKARYPMALADCFAVATAAAGDAELWTGDPEIIGADGLPCAVVDLRG